jgi:hypothetical protein
MILTTCISVISDPTNQNAFLERMSKNRRFAAAGFNTQQFDKLVKEEMKKHQVRLKDVASPNEIQAQSKAPGKVGLGMPQPSVKAPASPALPTTTNAHAVLRPLGPVSSIKSGPAKTVTTNPANKTDGGSAPISSSTIPAGGSAAPRPSAPRLSKKEQARRDEVDAFFTQLEREEAAEIAKYKAEHPLTR